MSGEGPERRGQPPRELVSLAASIRRVIDQILVTDEGHRDLRPDLARARELADQIQACLAPHASPGGGAGEPGPARPRYAGGPLLAAHNPIAPAVEIEHEDGVTRGKVSFGVLYEGPPGCVHGGHVSFFFDAILGYHNIACGLPAMTGTLTVRYRRPTPLLADLSFEARTARVSGRKVISRGWLRAGNEVTAEAEGLFVRPGSGFQETLREAHEAAKSDG